MLFSLALLWGALLLSFSEIVFNLNSLSLDFIALNFTLYSIDICLSLRLDVLSFLFLFLVITIGLATNFYTLNYFKNEADEGLFLFWLNSFVASMGLLVLASNFWTLFLGWELIGLTSFFLINFWYFRRGTLKSSFKAFAFNLVSDIFLLFSFVSFFLATGATEVVVVNHLIVTSMASYTYYAVQGCFFLFLAASIKSVQFGGHLWLPDSMEAPVPASSLIHSATLVSAGVYLLARFYDTLAVLGCQHWCLYSGAITAAYGGVVAASQTDMKKLLAYSTMSHCGFLYICLGFGNFYLLVLYLFLHGLFKAATFYCVGSFIRVFGSQDTRLMGCGHRLLPGDSLGLIFCSFNLAGLPFTVGYLYKSFFFIFLTATTYSFIVLGFTILALLTSVIYTFRLLYFSLFDFLKASTPYTLFYLQTSKVRFLDIYRVITWGQLYALFILLLTSLLVFWVTFYIFTYFAIEFSTYALLEGSNSTALVFYVEYFTSYFILFYFFYILGLCILLIGETRFFFLKLQSYWGLIYTFLGISSLCVYS